MIIVFDGHCVLCNGWVQFLLKHDTKKVYRFASIQSEAGAKLLAQAGLKIEGLETLLLVDGVRSYQHTAAILRVLDGLGWPWKAAWVSWIIPAPLRDGFYRWIARNRYRFFGRRDACLLPSAVDRDRFLDGVLP
ncbi:hypothetical protein BWI17_06965 [Betaproteobacteria bacterium GR16-43]|nr:hypothetical protein BWI17_06965 [Betaproteobacteria bacterium GR16-43]